MGNIVSASINAYNERLTFLVDCWALHPGKYDLGAASDRSFIASQEESQVAIMIPPA